MYQAWRSMRWVWSSFTDEQSATVSSKLYEQEKEENKKLKENTGNTKDKNEATWSDSAKTFAMFAVGMAVVGVLQQGFAQLGFSALQRLLGYDSIRELEGARAHTREILGSILNEVAGSMSQQHGMPMPGFIDRRSVVFTANQLVQRVELLLGYMWARKVRITQPAHKKRAAALAQKLQNSANEFATSIEYGCSYDGEPTMIIMGALQKFGVQLDGTIGGFATLEEDTY